MSRLAALLAFALCCAFDFAAYAAGSGTLACSSGSPSSGSLLGNSCSTLMDTQHLFRGLVCNYKLIIDQVLTYLYCGVAYVFEPTIAAVITLFVVIYGIKLALGLTQIREGFMVIMKILFVYAFGTQASWAIGVGYNFLIGLMENSMAWVMSGALGTSVPAGAATDTIFGLVDAIVYNTFAGPASVNLLMLLGFLALMSKALPPLFGLTLYFIFKSLILFTRAMLTYLLAISAIAFLIALSPMFLSFMLFQTTYTFFDSWLKHLASFVLQVMLVFAALAMWLMLMTYMGDFFTQLADAIRVVNEVVMGTGQLMPADSFGLCTPYTIGTGAFGPTLTCGGGGAEPIMASEIVKQAPFIYFFVVNILTLILAVYAFDTLIGQIPMIAKELSGPKSVSAIGGSVGPAGPDFPGLKGLDQMGEKAAFAAAKGETKTQKMLDKARGKKDGGDKDKSDDRKSTKLIGYRDIIGKGK